MASNSAPVVDRIRIIPRPDDFLDRNVGSSGEVFFNRATSSLRVYSGQDLSGFELARSDLANIDDSALTTKLTDLGYSQSGGNTSITVSNLAPEDAEQGQLWFDTDTGVLFVYYDEWVQPSTSSSGSAGSNYSNDNVDIHLNTDTAQNNQLLSWNGVDYNWVDPTQGGVVPNSFSVIAVSGQTDITADSLSDTLTLAAGNNITLTTNGNTVTINSATSSGASDFVTLSDAATASLTIDKIYEPAIAMFRLDNIGTSAYTFPSHYAGANPTLYVISGTTVAFDLDNIPGHPFELQDNTLSTLASNLVHVASDGTVSTDSDAQGKSSGTLYWRIPESTSGTYAYLCQSHSGMQGQILVKRLSTF